VARLSAGPSPLPTSASAQPIQRRRTTSASATSRTTGGIGIATRRWDFGDGDRSTKVSPRHRFDGGGSDDVRLTVTTFDGRETTTVRIVSVI
jgi:PKD repeat protein